MISSPSGKPEARDEACRVRDDAGDLRPCRRNAHAERLIVSVSNHRVNVTPNYSGEELVLFGSVEKDDPAQAVSGNYDLVVTVSGPSGGIGDAA